MEKIKWLEKLTNEEVLERIKEDTSKQYPTDWIDNILRRNCLLHDAIEGQMTEVKGVRGRRTQLLDDLRNRKSYWMLKDRKSVV